MHIAILLVLGGALLVVPGRVDRWALARGARPKTLAALAAVTLAGLAALPAAIAICASSTDARAGHAVARLVAVAALLVVALAAGRAIAHAVLVRRRLRQLRAIADALELPTTEFGVKVLPVPDLLAFAAGTDAFVSQGLLERLPRGERQAVLAHEPEHAAARHGRLLAAAEAVSHAWFGARAARAAEAALHRELDALADDAAARGTGQPDAVRDALIRLADRRHGDRATVDPRLRRLDSQRSGQRVADRLVQALTALLVLAAICVALHAGNQLVGVVACAVAVAVFAYLTAPALARGG
jgi:hypothetical protein